MCARGVEGVANTAVRRTENAPITAFRTSQLLRKAPFPLCCGRRESTKTHSETHIRRCRVRRKRKRLPSNGSIESDAAISLRVLLEDFCAASLPIEV